MSIPCCSVSKPFRVWGAFTTDLRENASPFTTFFLRCWTLWLSSNSQNPAMRARQELDRKVLDKAQLLVGAMVLSLLGSQCLYIVLLFRVRLVLGHCVGTIDWGISLCKGPNQILTLWFFRPYTPKPSEIQRISGLVALFSSGLTCYKWQVSTNSLKCV